jgi:hypothetical protein
MLTGRQGPGWAEAGPIGITHNNSHHSHPSVWHKGAEVSDAMYVFGLVLIMKFGVNVVTVVVSFAAINISNVAPFLEVSE